MRELQTIVEAWAEVERRGGQAALATVVKVEGSAYRRVGARMLVAADGRTWGGISGGCLEADIVLRAQAVLETGQAAVACYDTRDDADLYFGVGLGCNGVIQILIEPPGQVASRMAFFRDFLNNRQPVALATVFHTQHPRAAVGDYCTLGDQGWGPANLDEPRLLHHIQTDLKSALRRGTSGTKPYHIDYGTVEVCLEVLQPSPTLVIFGSGHDVMPLVQGAKLLGWHVTIADYRTTCCSEKFPLADAVIQAGTEAALARLHIDRRTAVVVMTHNYLQDLELLPHLLHSPAAYIGVLGSRRRAARLPRDLARDGYTMSASDQARLHAPVGLDIGAEAPEEIALAVLAEMQAAFARRSAQPLRERPVPLHANTLNATTVQAVAAHA